MLDFVLVRPFFFVFLFIYKLSDIMWAYLKQDATELLLSNQWRLSRAEEILKKTYNEQTAVLNIRVGDFTSSFLVCFVSHIFL